MHYFELNIGDYSAATMHLSPLEDGIYFRLLRCYYRDESPIDDAKKYRMAGARTPEEVAAVDAVLSDFFTLEGGCWRHRRCDRELDSYRSKSESARENGKKGGRPKKAKVNPSVSSEEPNQNPNETQENPEVSFGLAKKTQGKANQEPVTNNQISPNGDSAHAPAPDLDGRGAAEPPKLRPFDDWWAEFTAIYPRRGGAALNKSKAEQDARRKYGKPGFEPDEVLDGVRRYRAWCDATDKSNTEFVAQMTTWLNGKRWQEEYQIPDAPPKASHRVAESAMQRSQRLEESLGVPR